jgi:Protein of unknown function (DUF1264)
MKSKMSSYGKTWHVWSAGNATQPADGLPLGEPMLAWSFNRDGEAAPALMERMSERTGIDPSEKRRERQELVPLAKPQAGVDDLKGKFQRQTQPLPGVIDKRAASK